MTRTGEKVRSLVAEDAAFADALSVVLARAGHTADEPAPDGGTQPHTVRWSDVSDELTSGQWGRLIETGILYDADGDGFAISDPDDVREALGDDAVETSATVDPDEEGSSWSTYDKLAAVAALAFFPAYFVPEIQHIVGQAVDIVLGPL
ncbi:MAG TPA: HTR-like protein, partial [Halococcus sp.]|nr:HTR-like protein [Halococcus sp.]